MEAIVAFSKNYIIGINGSLPWHIPEDLKRFKYMTMDHVVIIGRKTYESLQCPLSNREHWVITRNPSLYKEELNVQFMTIEKAISNQTSKPIMIIGGSYIYNYFLANCYIKKIHVTYIDKIIPIQDNTVLFPIHLLSQYTLTAAEHSNTDLTVQYLTYEYTTIQHPENAYINLLKDIREHGHQRPDRTNTGTISTFGHQIRFDISTHVPLLTTKFVAWKSCIKELLWFLRGDTDAKKLSSQGVNIWNGNTTREFLDQRGLTDLPHGDIGGSYGFQWRHFAAQYKTCEEDYTGQGIDQLEQVLHSLRTDPYGRRHIITAWNPAALSIMALPPCHMQVQFYVTPGEPQQLSCHMYQRSVDCFLGLPFNIFSYTVLTYILAAKLGMKPKELIISTGDTHIYLDHQDAVQKQLEFTPLPLSFLRLSQSVITKSWEELSIDDFQIMGYLHYPAIKAKMSV